MIYKLLKNLKECENVRVRKIAELAIARDVDFKDAEKLYEKENGGLNYEYRDNINY